MEKKLKIVYMGTPEFAVAPLAALLQNGYKICAVITSPDKPAGRGLKLKESAVKKFALLNNLRLLQPTNLKSPDFIEELKTINPDLQIVVAFRMLPEVIWKLPVLGTFNLHASLLPQYRGAAPINHAIINGESKTGVTTFFINEHTDTGNIIMSSEVSILPEETAGELHDKLMKEGSSLVLQTVMSVEEKSISPIPQNQLTESFDEIKTAPKIFKDDCYVNWNASVHEVFNQIRGLSPYPTSYTELCSPEGRKYSLKIYRCSKKTSLHNMPTGHINTDGRTYISVVVSGGFIYLQEVQLSSKSKMFIDQFLRGFSINNNWKICVK